MFKILLTFGCLVVTLNLLAQESEEKNPTINSRSSGLMAIQVSPVFENLLHPGLRVGTNYLIKDRVKTKKRLFKSRQEKLGSKSKNIQYLADGHLGLYNHPNNHTGVYLGVGFTRLRITNRKNITLGWSFELSYLRRFYNLKTFELTENGSIKQVRAAGTNNVMLTIAPSIGKIYSSKKKEEAWGLYFKPSLLIQSYIHTFVANPLLEIGTTWYIF